MVPPSLILTASPLFSVRPAARLGAAILDVKSFAKRATYADIPAIETVEAAWEPPKDEAPVVPAIVEVTLIGMKHPADTRKRGGPPPEWKPWALDRYLADWGGYAGEEEERAAGEEEDE
jgi:hypothetical protein